MSRKQIIIQAQVSSETKETFQELYDGSGANSRGEFVNMLLESYSNPEIIEKEIEKIVEKPVEKIVEKPVEVIKEVEKIVEVTKEVSKTLDKNQILISLTPAQLAILEETSQNDETIETQNYYAISDDFQKRWPGLLFPLVEGENNIGRVLTNLFFMQIIDGAGDHIYTWSTREIRAVLESLSESDNPDNTDELDNIE